MAQDTSLRKTVFVTVGTTEFDLLIRKVCSEDVLKVLKEKGYNRLLLQIGRGQYEPEICKDGDLTVQFYRFKPTLQEDILDADLVISHAGAGTCLDVLGAGRRLLVVVNDSLMHNHQGELAERLGQDGHLHHCTCSTLVQALETSDWSCLQSLPPGCPDKVWKLLDLRLGFA